MMEPEDLLKDSLKQKDETVTLDFKREITLSSDKDKNEFAKDVSAFANRNGGHIVFGKEDPEQGGRIVGIRPETFDGEQMQQIISGRCYPPVNFDAQLMRIGNKSFVLLTIPESAAKPHEIIATRDVWVRRGNTSDKATDRERMLMRRETERKSRTSSSKESEEAADKYREKAMPTAFVAVFLMFFLPFRLATFWIFGRGLFDWINVETMGFVLVFAFFSAVGGYFFEPSFSNLVLRSARRSALPYLFSYAFFVLAVVFLNLTIFLYPETIRVFFQRTWQDFLFVCTLLLLITSTVVVLSHFPIIEYYSALKNKKYEPNPKKETRQLIENCRHTIKILRNGLPTIAILTLLSISLLIVPLDTSFGLFTPRTKKEPELFSSAMASAKGFIKVVFINATRGAEDNVSATYRYYGLMSTSYNIALPLLWLLSSLQISNPSNTSFTMGEYYPSLPATTEDWRIYVTVPTNVTYRASFGESPIPDKVTCLTIFFGNFSDGSRFLTNLTYWQEISPIENVVMNYHNLTFADLGNGTWTETHTIIITNNSNDTIYIPDMEYDRFMMDYVIRNSTQAYLNGNQLPFTELVSDTMLSLHAWIGPKMESTLKIVFLTTQNPE